MDQSSITGLRDTDKYFLMNIDTKIFLNMYQIKNRYLHSLFDEDMFRYRTEKEFPRLMHLKDERSWKRFYFNFQNQIDETECDADSWHAVYGGRNAHASQ